MLIQGVSLFIKSLLIIIGKPLEAFDLGGENSAD